MRQLRHKPFFNIPYFKKLHLLGFGLLCSFFFLDAQSLPETLLFNKVESVKTRTFSGTFPDSRGYVWFSTHGGLFRYDGKNIKVFKPDLEDVNSLSYAWCMDIIEDKKGKLWIGTNGGGLNSYDVLKDEWKHFYFDANDSTSLLTNIPHWMALDEEGLIWIKFHGHGGLCCFNPDTGKCQQFIPQPSEANQLQGGVSGKVVALGQKIFVATSAGLEYFDKTTQSFYLVPFLNAEKDTVPYRIYTPSIGKSKDGMIWVTTPDNQLGFYDENNETIKYFPLKKPAEPFPDQIREIEEDQQGNLLFCSYLGFWSLSSQRQQLQRHQLKDIETLQQIDYHTQNWLSVDKTGIIWLGNYYYDPRKKIFDFYEVFSVKDNGRLNVWGGERKDSSTLLLETEEGYYLFDWKQRKGSPVIRKPIVQLIKNGKPYNIFISYFDYDQAGNLWLATWGHGLIKIKKEILANPQGVVSRFDQWLAGDSLAIIPTNRLKSVYVDSHNDLWICGMEGGVTRLNPKTLQFTRFDHQQGNNSISDFYTFHAIEDDDNNIWISTKSGGINKFDRKTEKFKVFNVNGQMIGLDQFKIIKDTEGWLWFNSTLGLSTINPTTEQMRHYTQEDGLVSWEHDLTIDRPTNTLFLGGNLGLQVIQIDSLKKRPTYASPIRITEIQVFNIKEKTTQSLRPIDWNNQDIDLSHQENNLTIEFAVLDARNSSKQEYLYSFTNSQTPNWISNDDKTQVSFNQLGAGNYYFHLKGCNSDKIWTTLEQPLQFIIHPPFWQTTWAYLLYSLVLLGIFYALYRFNLNRQLEQAEARQLKEMDNLKSRFYTNITHEFRTPLTVILGMTNELETASWRKKLEQKHKNQLSTITSLITRNGKKLLGLINQLLDLSKLDTHNLKPHYKARDVTAFIQYVGESFESLAEKKDVRLSIYSEIDQLIMDIDEAKLQQIISNLLSNAIKFTPAHQKVALHLSQKEEMLQIKVKDRGIGIAPDALSYIFDRFYQVDNQLSRQGEGTGIGLALVKELVELMDGKISVKSELSKGTTFVVLLPIRKIEIPNEKHISMEIKKAPSLVQEITNIKTESLIRNQQEKALPLNDDSSKPQLLIAEDNPDVVFYIQSVLADHYQITIAPDGQAGIDKAIETIPDIIISDVMMPKKNGFELVETLKQDERTSHIPIVLLTAKATQQDKLSGLKYGADAYLMKPFDKEELLVRLEKLLEVRKALQQHYASQEVSVRTSLSQEDLFLQKFHTILEENYENPQLKVQQIAQEMQLSYQQLNRKLKALTDKTAALHLRSFRLQKAKVLLMADNDLNISEVCYDVGFDSPNYFTRVFVEEFGVSPNEIRNTTL